MQLDLNLSTLVIIVRTFIMANMFVENRRMNFIRASIIVFTVLARANSLNFCLKSAKMNPTFL